MRPTDIRPFVATGNTVKVSATNSSSSTAISAPRASNAELPGSCRIYNKGSDLIYFNFSIGAGTATANDVPVPAGNTEMFEMPAGVDHVNIICDSTTATVFCTPGQGA